MYDNTELNIINIDILLQCLTAFVSIDLFIFNKNKFKTSNSYSEYWKELYSYLNKYKLNICFIGFIILIRTLISSIKQLIHPFVHSFISQSINSLTS